MNRLTLRAQLAKINVSAEEEPIRQRMFDLLDCTGDCFKRSSFPAHFTGSALVVSADGKRVLLHHHRKLNRWMQFGGHCEEDSGILEVAHREALEESGIKGLRTLSETPFDLDIHEIPARPATGEPAHFHYDVRFLFAAPANAVFIQSEESLQLRWFKPEELADLCASAGLKRLLAKWKKLRNF